MADHVRVLADPLKNGATDVYIHSGQRDQGKVVEFLREGSFATLAPATSAKAA